MTRRFASVLAIVCPCVTVLALTLTLPATPLRAQAPDAKAHLAWMSEASDAQEDYRFAVVEKDPKAAQAALVTLESLMAKTEDYWAAKKAADGVKLSKDARAQAARAAAAVKAGDAAAAATAFDAMNATCNACHELHLENR